MWIENNPNLKNRSVGESLGALRENLVNMVEFESTTSSILEEIIILVSQNERGLVGA